MALCDEVESQRSHIAVKITGATLARWPPTSFATEDMALSSVAKQCRGIMTLSATVTAPAEEAPPVGLLRSTMTLYGYTRMLMIMMNTPR